MPRRNKATAACCLAGNRQSKRYTRTLVSINAATAVQILPRPAPVARLSSAGSCYPRLVALRRFIKQPQPRFDRIFHKILPGRNHADDLPLGNPLDFIARPQSVLFRDRFGNRNLVLRRDLGQRRVLPLLNCSQERRLGFGMQTSRCGVRAAGLSCPSTGGSEPVCYTSLRAG